MSLQTKVDAFNTRVLSEGWGMQFSYHAETPITSAGLRYLNTEADLLLAMCLNNGYYNRENIYRMLKFALNFSKRVQIFTTDGPAKHNYAALGKAKEKIPAVTRLARNRLRNQCIDSLARINAELLPSEQRIVTFMDWEAIYKDTAYIDSYKRLKNLYATNAEFHKDIDDTSERVLLHRIGIEKEVRSALSIGIEYVLEELAFILAYKSLGASSKPIQDHGVQGFSYFYYEPWSVFEKLVNGSYDSEVKEGIGFAIVKIEELGHSSE
jgi:tRNA-dependent cyclodipeptide synthase